MRICFGPVADLWLETKPYLFARRLLAEEAEADFGAIATAGVDLQECSTSDTGCLMKKFLCSRVPNASVDNELHF